MKLHNYQVNMVDFILHNKKCAVWADMGLGKTAIAISAIGDLFDNVAIGKVLVIAPLRPALHTWIDELGKWRPDLTYKVLAGLPPTSRLAALRDTSDIHIINRENIPWLITSLKHWKYDCVIIDEAHSFKNSKSKRFKALKKAIPHIDRMIQLTGTPSTNGLDGLWSQMFLLDGGHRLGKTFSGFRDNYFNSDYMGFKYELKEGAEERIHNRVSDICVSLKAEDYLDMPDRIDNIIEVELPLKVMNQYRELEKESILELGEDSVISADHVATLMNKMMQFCNGAVYHEDGEVSEVHDCKLDALAELIEDGEPLLIAYTYISDKDRIVKRFNAATLDDDNIINRWNKGEVPILLIHPASGGSGLNLQMGGNKIVWFGVTYNLEHKLQLDARLHRQGQTKTVVVNTLTIKDSIEQRVIRVLESKDLSQGRLLDCLTDIK